MNYYNTLINRNDLRHHGIEGQKWGVRNGPPYPLSRGKKDSYDENKYKRLRNAKISNIEKWGKSEDTNILYITGFSGSGKTTAAEELSNKNTNTIHLDLFLEYNDAPKDVILDGMDEDFIRYLNKNMPDFWKLQKNNYSSEERQRLMNLFMDNIDGFSKEQYENNKKIIIEGLQIADDMLYPDKNFFKDKPLVIMDTNPFLSYLSAASRDGQIIRNLSDIKGFFNWYKLMNVKMNELGNAAEVKKAVEQLEEYLRKL